MVTCIEHSINWNELIVILEVGKCTDVCGTQKYQTRLRFKGI